MNNRFGRYILVVFRVGIAGLALLAELNAGLTSNNFVWNFDSGITDPDAQGWILVDCHRPEVKDGVLSFDFSSGLVPRLELKTSMWKSRIVPSDYGALLVNMRVEPKGESPFHGEAEFQWSGGNSRKCSKRVTLINDGKFHSYRFDLSSDDSWSTLKRNRGNFSLAPVISRDKCFGRVLIDRIRFVPLLQVVDKEKSAIAEERLTAALDRLAGIRKRGIEIKGVDSAMKTLYRDFKALGSGSETVRLAKLAELEKRFAVIYGLLEQGRVVASLEENVAEMEKSLAFRHDAGSRAVSELKGEIQAIAALLSRGRFDGLNQKLQAAELRCRSVWDALLAENDWQLGVSNASFGRFGWVSKNDGMLFGEVGKSQIARRFFKFSNGANAMFRFEPVHVVPVSGTVEQINWIYRQELYRYRLKNKREGYWRVRKSLAANGVMVETDIPDIALSMNNGSEVSPAKIVFKAKNGMKIVTRGEGFKPRDMAENWLLLLPSGEVSSVPWLVTFQHVPETLVWERSRLLVGRARGMGCVGITAPWGVKPLKPGFADDWKRVPEEAAARCRIAAEVMNSFPVSCDEFFAIDRQSDRVRIVDLYRYFEPGNDWNTKARQVAPVPPVLSFAIAHGYPAVIDGTNIMPDTSTIYGPYYASAGNRAAYTLPLPDLRSPVPLKTPLYPEWQSQINELAKTFFPLKVENQPMQLMPMRSQVCLYSWNIIDDKAKTMLLENIKVSLDRYLNLQHELGSFDNLNDRTIERTEPFTGASYLAYGWKSKRFGRILIGDVANFAGMDLHSISLYLKFSGNLPFIRENWSKIVRLFSSCPRRSDWAVMGQDCMEYGLTHTIDMGPDSWLAPVGMSRLAARVNDRRMEELSLYMAARQAVPLCAAFSKRPLHMEFSNTWDWEKQIPETGYTEFGTISGVDWYRADLAYSFIAGIIIAPECFRLYRDFCPDAAREFEFGTLEKYYPQWRDPKFKHHPKKPGYNAPGSLTRHVLLREALGEPTEKLAEIVRNGLLEGTGEKLYEYVPCGGLLTLAVMAKAFLIGRDAPCEMVDWESSKLKEAGYDPERQTVSVSLEADRPFNVSFIAGSCPTAIMVNGKKLDGDKWQFDPRKRSLTISVDDGPNILLELKYDRWEAPKRVALKAGAGISITGEMKICRGEKPRVAAYGKDRLDFQFAGEPFYVNLNGVLNMSTATCPVKNGSGWLGMENRVGGGPEGTGLSNLHFGCKKFRGVPFRLANPRYHQGRSVLGLNGPGAFRLPKKSGPLKIGKRLRKLYFLHTAASDAPDGATLLKYRIKYSDGYVEVFKVDSGRDIGDWRNPRELTNARLAFRLSTGSNRKGPPAGAYISVWENNRYEQVAVNNAAVEQRPLAEIESVEIESAGIGAVAVLAITGENI